MVFCNLHCIHVFIGILACRDFICCFAQNEGMTGVLSRNGVFSRLTFALYEDSGYVLEQNNNLPRPHTSIVQCLWLVVSCYCSMYSFLHTVYLCVHAVPMSLIWDSDMYGFVSEHGLSVAPSHLLSLLSPSSWYDVDYSVASPLRFGQCLGCDFAEKSCFSHG